MGLDVYLIKNKPTEVFSAGITHNLSEMAREAGIYYHLWKPEEISIEFAKELIEPLEAALIELKANPVKYEKFNSPNGWGLYKHFVPFVEKYLNACKENPDAEIRVWR